MGQMDKNLKNELFKVAVDYIYKKHLVNSQGELADKIGISESALSRIMNNKKFVGDDTLRKMNEAFDGIFNMAYFRGENIYLLMEDYLAAKAKKIGMEIVPSPYIATSPSSQIDQSSITNALLARADEHIAALERELSSKDKMIEIIQEQSAKMEREKDARIAELKELADERLHRIADLRRIIDTHQYGLENLPFPTGVAEGGKAPKRLQK